MMFILSLILNLFAVTLALPISSPIANDVPNTEANEFTSQMLKFNDFNISPSFDAELKIIYYLFTRENPVESQTILARDDNVLKSSNYNPNRRTVFIIHGWMSNAQGDLSAALVPGFLQADDLNVIVVDWSVAAINFNFIVAADDSVTYALAMAKFLSRLISTGADPEDFHIVGHSFGGHMAGIIGRNLGGQISYITCLDPASPGFIGNKHRLRSTDAIYTEVIHSNGGAMGFLRPLGDVDFYPNGGSHMIGCDSEECDHMRSYLYFAESLTSGGFTGRRCDSYEFAVAENCSLPATLKMGGLLPKTGATGIYYLRTNSAPPYSRD